MAWYIGLMSGTSLDGIDGVLARTGDGPAWRASAHVHLPLPAGLRAELLALNSAGPDELHRAALAANGMARAYAAVVAKLLNQAGRTAAEIGVLGAHGQTVRHRPGEFDGLGYTLQLLNGALLAELTGIAVACDFRSGDVAAGGQGAPLVPAFHAAVFGEAGQDRAVLNLGGIANLSLLPADGPVLGFDCGPGNVLMDLWCQRQRGLAFDAGGRWAASGRVDPGLLGRLLSEPYLQHPAPKSTGRDLFNGSWLDTRLGTGGQAVAEDVMATLAEFTARSVADALTRHAPGTQRLLVCGGGAANDDLMHRLALALGADTSVSSTASFGIAPDQVEALAFAWLARARVDGHTGNLPSVTGALGPRVLGALYAAP